MNFFGTDGIRGTYGSTLTDSTAYLLGKSLALIGEDCPIVVVARDTRNSGEKLFGALASGVYDGGGNVINLGMLPTNAVGHFVRKFGGDFGVMITASHNPPCDNGLKVFDRYGVKLCAAKQEKLSQLMDCLPLPDGHLQRVHEPVFYDIDNIYRDDVIRAVGARLDGMKVALDCCFGASCRVAGSVFEAAGANVCTINDRACGDKINVDCGATHPEVIADFCKGKGIALGFAFDGDADRLAVSEDGRIVPNNKVYYAIAKFMSEEGLLKQNTVVGTTLTNGGVVRALSGAGVSLLRSDVGDTNVFNLMAANALNFGGEESGHYLLTDFATSSDALINALFVAAIVCRRGSLAEYSKECTDVPYVQQSIALCDSNELLTTKTSLDDVATQVRKLYPECRVVLRKSGTENKLRVYVEGCEAEEAYKQIAATFAK
uniref:phosphoglucosamine mutase n=1 Tax=Candidatus Fimenecus sp. TaxID=3022888 RepID=UPI0040267B5B